MTAQATFKTKAEYLEWRAHWRKQYLGLAREIRRYKDQIKSGESAKRATDCQALLARRSQMARHLMIARRAVDLEHLIGFQAWAEEKNKRYENKQYDLLEEKGIPKTSGRSVKPGNR